jgi:hypothetical protein
MIRKGVDCWRIVMLDFINGNSDYTLKGAIGMGNFRRLFSLSGAICLVSGAAAAGACVGPGPEIGDGAAGLVVVSLLIGGYFLLRFVRTRKH